MFDLYDFFQIMIYILWIHVHVRVTYTHRDDSGTTMSVSFQYIFCHSLYKVLYHVATLNHCYSKHMKCDIKIKQ